MSARDCGRVPRVRGPAGRADRSVWLLVPAGSASKPASWHRLTLPLPCRARRCATARMTHGATSCRQYGWRLPGVPFLRHGPDRQRCFMLAGSG